MLISSACVPGRNDLSESSSALLSRRIERQEEIQPWLVGASLFKLAIFLYKQFFGEKLTDKGGLALVFHFILLIICSSILSFDILRYVRRANLTVTEKYFKQT